MDGFEVPVEALREAALAGASAIAGVTALPLDQAAAAVGAAVPGGAADAAAVVLAPVWRARLEAAADALTHYAEALRAVADCYDAAERKAVASLAGEP
jgi:hypothetical protein